MNNECPKCGQEAVKHVPPKYSPVDKYGKYRRKVKWGRIGFRDIILIILDTMAIFYRMHILKYYDKVSNENNEDNTIIRINK